MTSDSVVKAGFPDFYRLARDLESGNADLSEGQGGSKNGDFGKQPITAAELADSNVITSRVVLPPDHKGDHKIVLDLDIDAALVPSSTPGHYHLIINKILTEAEYMFFLKACEVVGVIEPGYYKASVNRGATVIRTPWTKK